MMDVRMAVIGAVALGLGAGAATLALSPLALAPSRVCNPPAQIMSRLELLFGMKRPDGSEVGGEDWRAFLDTEVTRAFQTGSPFSQATASGAINREWWAKKRLACC